MSDTPKYIEVLKDKITQVEIPPVNEAWEKMNQMIEAAPVQAGKTPVSGLRYLITLNGIVGFMIVSSCVLIYSMSKGQHGLNRGNSLFGVESAYSEEINSNNRLALGEKPEQSANRDFTETKYLSDQNEYDNTARYLRTKQEDNLKRKTHQSAVAVKSGMKRKEDEVEEITRTTDTLSRQPFHMRPNSGSELDIQTSEEEGYHMPEKSVSIHSYLGVHIGMQLMPLLPGSPKTISGGLLGGVNCFGLNSGLQAQLNYNAIAIRPISHVETQNVSGVKSSDSMVISNINYLSAPLLVHLGNGNFGLSFGPQFSKLWSVKGDNYSGINSTGSTEYGNPERNSNLISKNLVNQWNVGLLVAFSGQNKSGLGFSVEFQQSLTNYAKNNLSVSAQNYTALHLKVTKLLYARKKVEYLEEDIE
ncbi:MAG: hypothetical protein GC181_00215 [Bacteroidetes bacterium]|nr:hypothetical protein [Bacteroidota bacterium]